MMLWDHITTLYVLCERPAFRTTSRYTFSRHLTELIETIDYYLIYQIR